MQEWHKTLAAMWVAMFFVFLEITLSIAFFPVFLQEDLGLTFDQAEFWVGFLIAMPSVVMFFAQPIAGLAADRIGRKRVVLFSVVATSLCRALWYFAQSPGQILLLGMMAGLLGAGGVTSSAIVAAAAPREKIGTVMGAFQTSWSLGFVVGPITGAFLSGLVGYRGTFLAQAAFAALGGAVILVWVRENHRPERDPSRRGLVRTLTADLRPLASSRPVLVLWTAMFTMMFGFALVFPLFTLYVQELGIPKDRVAIMSGMMMFIVGGIQSVLAPLFGRLGDRLGHKGVMVVGAYAVGAFIAPQAFVADFWQFLTLRLFSTAAGAAMMPTSNALLASLMPARQYGGAYGVLGSSRTLAVAIGPLVGGVVAAHFGIRATFLLCAAFSFASAVWAHYGIRPPPQAIPAPSSRPE